MEVLKEGETYLSKNGLINIQEMMLNSKLSFETEIMEISNLRFGLE